MDETSLDIIDGLSGLLLVMRSSKHLINKELYEKITHYCILKILKYNLDASKKLLGFSHGITGLSYSLACFDPEKNSRTISKFIEMANIYEDSYYSEKNKNWKDLREHVCTNYYPVYFCHGAPGIGLAKCLLPPCYIDSNIKKQVKIAMKTTLKKGFHDDFNLCHGDLGNFDFLLEAIPKFNIKISRKIDDLGLILQKKLLDRSSNYNVIKDGINCGLMTGEAGIAYFALRLLNKNMPNILALDT